MDVYLLLGAGWGLQIGAQTWSSEEAGTSPGLREVPGTSRALLTMESTLGAGSLSSRSCSASCLIALGEEERPELPRDIRTEEVVSSSQPCTEALWVSK